MLKVHIFCYDLLNYLDSSERDGTLAISCHDCHVWQDVGGGAIFDHFNFGIDFVQITLPICIVGLTIFSIAQLPCQKGFFQPVLRTFSEEIWALQFRNEESFLYFITLPVSGLNSSPKYLFHVKIFQAVKLMLTTQMS